jgi:hypothetical protein
LQARRRHRERGHGEAQFHIGEAELRPQDGKQRRQGQHVDVAQQVAEADEADNLGVAPKAAGNGGQGILPVKDGL